MYVRKYRLPFFNKFNVLLAFSLQIIANLLAISEKNGFDRVNPAIWS